MPAIIIFGVMIGLMVNWFISEAFMQAAEEKGYTERMYFWMCFFLGIIGYLLVIALPDRRPVSNVVYKEKKEDKEVTQKAVKDELPEL